MFTFAWNIIAANADFQHLGPISHHSNTTIPGTLVTQDGHIRVAQAFAGFMTDGNLRQTCKLLLLSLTPSSESLTEHSRTR